MIFLLHSAETKKKFGLQSRSKLHRHIYQIDLVIYQFFFSIVLNNVSIYVHHEPCNEPNCHQFYVNLALNRSNAVKGMLSALYDVEAEYYFLFRHFHNFW